MKKILALLLTLPLIVTGYVAFSGGSTKSDPISSSSPTTTTYDDASETGGLTATGLDATGKPYKTDPNAKVLGFSSLGAACGDKSADREELYTCTKHYIDAAVPLKGFMATASDVNDSVGKFPEINAICHQFSHYIGKGAWIETGNKVREAAALSTNRCSWGYLHGLNVAIGETYKNDKQKLFDTVLDGCMFVQETGGNASECAHGMGDAFLSSNDLDLLKAISWCAKIPDKGLHETCAQGVGNYWADYRVIKQLIEAKAEPLDYEKELLTGKPYAACQLIKDDIDSQGCYDYVTHFAFVYPNKLDDMAKHCAELKGNPNAWCMQGLGREYAFDKDMSEATALSKCNTAREQLGVNRCVNFFLGSRTQIYLDKTGAITKKACTGNVEAARDRRLKIACEYAISQLQPYYDGKFSL